MPVTGRLPTLSCLIVTLAVCTIPAIAGNPAPPPANQQVENLFAFARLYGYVRYFHPSDQAAGIDWDRFVIYGAERVASLKTEEELKAVLEELFLPVAPLLRLCPNSPPAPCPAPAFTKEQMAGKVIAWQHLGVQGTGPLYRSARTGRGSSASGQNFGGMTQSLPVQDLRGKTIRVRAAVRAQVQGPGNAAYLWGRVDRPNRQFGWFDNMKDRPIADPQWKEYEISGPVSEDAISVFFGCVLAGTGEAMVDAWRIDVRKQDGTWETVKIANPEFEEKADSLEGWASGPTAEYAFAVVEDAHVYSGKRSAIIRSTGKPGSTDLFVEKPILGEVIDKPLMKGLRLVLPLALPDPSPSSSAEAARLAALNAKLAAVDPNSATAASLSVRLADIVIAWNIFQHFFPYFDVVDCDWPAEFRRAASKALKDSGPEDFYVTLTTLAAALQDGHVNVFAYDLPPRRRLPAAFDCVEGTVVVTGSEDPSIKSGDVVLEVNGQRAAAYLEGLESPISGSPQWKRWKALSWEFGSAPRGSSTTLKLRRGSQEILVTASPNLEALFQPEPAKAAIERLPSNAFYVDMRRAKMAEIEKRMDELASAAGIIFDMRGYPTDNYEVICHLIDTPVQSAIWQVPRTIYPDREKLVGYDTSGRWSLEPKKPRLKKAVFLTSAAAISYAETIMGIVEHYRLGEIVGEPTAGTNGNVNSMRLPGRFGMSWTGMRVIKHDGSQHHLVGIRPTVPVRRTLRSVQEGRDEVLEKALELFR